MAKDQAYPPVARSRSRTPAPRQTAAVSARAEEHAPRKPFNPLQFFREVRVEARKITWPTWRETWITSLMVFIMVVITAIFFFLVDLALSLGVTQILKLGG
ncbi:MAG TPA: preprotein translocase subunit SecE [Caulobacteraceae bacterium]